MTNELREDLKSALNQPEAKALLNRRESNSSLIAKGLMGWATKGELVSIGSKKSGPGLPHPCLVLALGSRVVLIDADGAFSPIEMKAKVAAETNSAGPVTIGDFCENSDCLSSSEVQLMANLFRRELRPVADYRLEEGGKKLADSLVIKGIGVG